MTAAMEPPARGQVVVDALSARLGGGLSYLVNQLQALERVAPELDLHVLAAPENHQALADALRAPITVVPGGRLRPLVEQARLPWWGRPGDVLYCPGNFAPLLPTRARVVLTLQNPNYVGAGRRAAHNQSADRLVRSRLARLSAVRADRVVVISAALLAALAEDLPEVAARADLVPSGGPTWPRQGMRPARLPSDVDDFFLVLANDAPHKHIDRVVAAWSAAGAAGSEGGALAGRHPDLVIAGGFFDPARAEAQRALVPSALQARFHQIGAVTARAEVRWLLEHARALVSVASLEAHPLTPAEAGSLGCPLVLSDIAAHREVAGARARYVTPGHAAELEGVLRELAAEAPARQTWHWPVSWDDNARQLAAIFEAELAGGAPAGTARADAASRGSGAGRDIPITVFTNIPNPYNDRLYGALRASGATVRVVYKRTPADEGRPWPLQLHPDEHVAASLADEARAWRDAAGTHVILTGSYATATDLARRVATARGARTVHVWGERLRPNNVAVRLLRRAYLQPLPASRARSSSRPRSHPLDGILAVGSRAVVTYLDALGGASPHPPIHTFPYTTDRGLDTAPAPATRPTIGYAGRLLPSKGVDVLVRAVAAIAPEVRPRLEVAGDGPEAARLRDLARSLGVEGAVAWLGALTPDQLDERRASWWLQAVPAQRTEGWGVVVPEALCSGVPVVVSDHVNAAADLVRDGEDGVVIDAEAARDPDAWASVITTILGDAATRAELRVRSREVAAAFAPVHAAAFLLDVLDRAAQGRRDGSAVPPRSFVDESWQRADTIRREPATGRPAHASDAR